MEEQKYILRPRRPSSIYPFQNSERWEQSCRMRRSRSVFIIWTAWTKSLSPLYSMSHTLFATEQKMNISEDATGNNCPPSASEFRDQQRTLLIKKQQLYLKTTLIMQSHLEEMMSGSKIQLSANGVLNYCQIETP